MGACIFEVTGWQRPIILNLRGGCRKGSIFDNHQQNDHVYSNIHIYIQIYINSIFSGSQFRICRNFEISCDRSCLRQESDWIHHHVCRLSCLLAIQVTDRDGSIDDGSRNHSSFCMLQRAVSYNGHGQFSDKVCQTSYWKNYHECLNT